MAASTAPTKGSIKIAGRVAPFIELGVGFNPELTARENVLINAVMMGLTPKEARDRFDAVIEFAEIEEFIDLKVKNYSSGMQVRLAFSTMVQSDADVMLIDEVLAVGDAAFQQKCFGVFDRLRSEGKTIVLGDPRHGHGRALLRPGPADQQSPARAHRRPAAGVRALSRHQLLPDPLNDGNAAPQGDRRRRDHPYAGRRSPTASRRPPPSTARRSRSAANVRAPVAVEQPEVRMWIENASGVEVFAASTLEFGKACRRSSPASLASSGLKVDNRMVSAPTNLSAMLIEHSPSRRALAVRNRAARFDVVGGDHVGASSRSTTSCRCRKPRNGRPREHGRGPARVAGRSS